MKTFIKAHRKILLVIAAVVICLTTFLLTKETLAKTLTRLPSVTTLQLIDFEIAQTSYAYTGEPIEGKLIRLVLEDEDGERIVRYRNQIVVQQYLHNTACGYADIQLEIEGYQGLLCLERAFQIRPQQVQDLTVTEASLEHIQLVWDEIPNVHGYLLYKSKDQGETYFPIKEVFAGEERIYQDTKIALNETYLYRVKGFVNVENDLIFSDPSEIVQQDTPLEKAAFKSVYSIAFNALKLQWNMVAGAAGYQIYRSNSQDGTYHCIAEISDGATTSYTDGSCELGVPYYYYMKAAQSTNDTLVYGEASAIVSAKTSPNKPAIAGLTSADHKAVTLSWSQAEGAQGYEIYKSESPTSGFQHVATISSPDVLNWSEEQLDERVTYYYKIRSYAVINGVQLFSIYSGIYEKEITIIQVEVSGEIAALTQYAGRPYKYGGTSPTNGWDCSAFVQYVFKQHFGVSLPRTAMQQAGGGVNIGKTNREAWQPGDLLFYKEKGKISHVAIYLGNNQIIHALSEKYDTLIQDVDYYEVWDNKTSLYCVKRYLK